MYSFCTASHGIRRRSAASASRARVSSFSFTSSRWRAASHSCGVTIDGVFIVVSTFLFGSSLAFVSHAPQADIARVKARMGWSMPWYTMTDKFDADFGVDEYHGTNAFFRDGDRVFRTYFVNNRGDEAHGSTWSYLDMTALGRQEEWEDSPEGYPQSAPYKWWNWHDAYGHNGPSQG